MNKLKFIATLAIGVVLMTSCLSDDDRENIWKNSFTDNYTRVVNTATSTESLINGAIYVLECDLNNSTAELAISNLILEPGFPSIGLTLKNLRYGYNDEGALEVKASAVTSSDGGVVHEITNLNLVMFTRTVPQASSYAVTYSISFTVDGIYSVRAIQNNAMLTGVTEVRTIDSSEAASNQDLPYYAYTLDITSGTANFWVYNLRVDGKLISAMQLRSIPFSAGDDCVTIATSGPIDATTTDNESTWTVTDFNARPNYNGRMPVNFILNDKFSVSATLGEPVNN